MNDTQKPVKAEKNEDGSWKVIARCSICGNGYITIGRNENPTCMVTGCDGDIKPTKH